MGHRRAFEFILFYFLNFNFLFCCWLEIVHNETYDFGNGKRMFYCLFAVSDWWMYLPVFFLLVALSVLVTENFEFLRTFFPILQHGISQKFNMSILCRRYS